MAAELGLAALSRGKVAIGKFDFMVRVWWSSFAAASSASSNHWPLRGFLFNEWPFLFPTCLLTRLWNRGGVLLLHIPCQSFASLFVVRFFLGLAEACIVPAFLLSMSMFFTYQEQAVLMPIMWSVGNASPITSGLLSYGALWINTGSFASWKWLMGP